MSYSPSTSAFPTSLDSAAVPNATSDTSDFDHAGLESYQNDAITKLQAKVGVDSSAVATSLDKRVSDVENSVVVKATGAEVDTGTDDAKFVTAKAMEDSSYVKSTAVPVKASGAEIDTGTDDAKFVTAKAVADSKINRNLPRTTTETSSATPTINTDNTDVHTITALAAAITSMTTNLSGTPVNGQKLIVRVKDDGTARAITWGASFASRGATLPTTTILSKTMYVGFLWNSTASTWDCVGVVVET